MAWHTFRGRLDPHTEWFRRYLDHIAAVDHRQYLHNPNTPSPPHEQRWLAKMCMWIIDQPQQHTLVTLRLCDTELRAWAGSTRIWSAWHLHTTVDCQLRISTRTLALEPPGFNTAQPQAYTRWTGTDNDWYARALELYTRVQPRVDYTLKPLDCIHNICDQIQAHKREASAPKSREAVKAPSSEAVFAKNR